jgi:hypothetical protein
MYVLKEAFIAARRAAIAVCSVLATSGTNTPPRAVSAPIPYVFAMPDANVRASATSACARSRSAHTGSALPPLHAARTCHEFLRRANERVDDLAILRSRNAVGISAGLGPTFAGLAVTPRRVGVEHDFGGRVLVRHPRREHDA